MKKIDAKNYYFVLNNARVAYNSVGITTLYEETNPNLIQFS